MIGDAVLARFHGPDRARQAVVTAIAIQRAVMADRDCPWGVGIGIFSGPAVAGLIGAGDRLDYTVIGDSVNTVARLCALAGAARSSPTARPSRRPALPVSPKKTQLACQGTHGRTGGPAVCHICVIPRR